MLDLVQDIIMQSAGKVAAAATLKANDPTAIYTPHAMDTFNAEMEWANT